MYHEQDRLDDVLWGAIQLQRASASTQNSELAPKPSMQLSTTGADYGFRSGGHEQASEDPNQGYSSSNFHDITTAKTFRHDCGDGTMKHSSIEHMDPLLLLSNISSQQQHNVVNVNTYYNDSSYDFNGIYEPALSNGFQMNSNYPHVYGKETQMHTLNEQQGTQSSEAAECYDSPPCTDPTCDDFFLCDEQSTCCYLEQCLAGQPCDSEDCQVEVAASPPCFKEDCHEPPCTEPHTTTLCAQAHQHGAHATGDAIHACVDPACLSNMNPHFHHNATATLMPPPSKRRRLSNSYVDTSFLGYYPPMERTYWSAPEHITPSAGMTYENGYHQYSDTNEGRPSKNLYHNHHSTSDHMYTLPEENSTSSLDQVHTCRWVDALQICGAAFLDEHALQQHVDEAHISGPLKQAQYCCCWEGCSKLSITDSADVVKHEQFDEDSSSFGENVGSHSETPRSHAHEERRSFGTRPKLKRHVQVHTGYKPYKCEVCGVQMKTKDALVKHQRTHTGEKPYICHHCDKRFATTTELKTHSTVHTGEKPHVCPECGERFADSSNLSKHKKTHFSGMFRCEDCGAQMKRWDQMKRHIEQRKHMQHLLTDNEANRAYKARMTVGFKPERLEGRPEQKRRRDDPRERSFSTFSEQDFTSPQFDTNQF